MEFANPPSARRLRYMTPDVTRTLDARQGEWALVFPSASPSCRSAVAAWCRRNPSYETTSRVAGRDPLRFDVYVRAVEVVQ